MALTEFNNWLGEFSAPEFVWYVKRLSGNDTLANGAHQYGPYIPKDFLFDIFPMVNSRDLKNPDHWFNIYIDSHNEHRLVRVIYYNNKFHENPKSGRDEARITNFGGSSSVLLQPDSTGTLTIFAFALDATGVATECHVWLCRHEIEEELVEDRIGPVEPGKSAIRSSVRSTVASLFPPVRHPRASCWLERSEVPSEWLSKFPTGAEIIRKAVDLRPDSALDPDHRIMRRRECEYDIFRSLEEAVELPLITAGFTTLDGFIARAQTILQRRKSRAGHSLELHVRAIFIEERLREGLDFSHSPKSESGKEPDFLFPSQTAYRDLSFPDARLRMLAVKTTCKDRWRQILNEADRIPRKHLLTLQEGVSEGQFREMVAAGVQLVVPSPVASKFPNRCSLTFKRSKAS